MSMYMTDMLNLASKKLLALLTPLALLSPLVQSTQVTVRIKKTPEFSDLTLQFFDYLKAVIFAICPNRLSLPKLFFSVVFSIGSLMSMMAAHAQAELSMLSFNTISKVGMPTNNMRHINQTAGYRIYMLPSLQKQHHATPLMVADTDGDDDNVGASSTTEPTEPIEIDKVELASLQVMHVLSEICPSLLPASQRGSFQRAFNARLQELLPSVSNPQVVMQALSTQRTYRYELNSLKSWINGLSKSEKSILCREIAIATL